LLVKNNQVAAPSTPSPAVTEQSKVKVFQPPVQGHSRNPPEAG